MESGMRRPGWTPRWASIQGCAWAMLLQTAASSRPGKAVALLVVTLQVAACGSGGRRIDEGRIEGWEEVIKGALPSTHRRLTHLHCPHRSASHRHNNTFAAEIAANVSSKKRIAILEK